jgi:pyruvate dehydrogenase E2 component (dihydrolipoamide acetyltransferase)
MAQVTEVAVPDIGDFDDVPVIEILVEEGATVAVDDPLVTLESDKATMEIPAPHAGVVEKILVKLGDKVSEGTPIVRLAAEGNGAGPAPDTASADSEPAPDAVASEVAPEPEVAAAEEAASVAEDTSAEPAADDGGGPAYASPSVRRRAHELGIDLSTVTGTGRKGRITIEDVENSTAAPAPAAAPAGFAGLPPWPTVDFAKFGEIERVPLSRIQKISGPLLTRNWVMIPHVTQHEDADITELEAFRKGINAEQSDVKVTMVALMLKAVVASLKQFPDFNSSLDGDALVRKHYYHLGFAADTPQGLVVPVIRDVDRKGLLEIAAELMELSGKARAGKLMPGDMAGGTFTISSLGGIGGSYFTPIINAPEVCVLGVSRSQTKPVWDGTGFAPRLMVPLSLSYDHRVIDGASAARFVVHLAGVLADMRRVLL